MYVDVYKNTEYVQYVEATLYTNGRPIHLMTNILFKTLLQYVKNMQTCWGSYCIGNPYLSTIQQANLCAAKLLHDQGEATASTLSTAHNGDD